MIYALLAVLVVKTVVGGLLVRRLLRAEQRISYLEGFVCASLAEDEARIDRATRRLNDSANHAYLYGRR